MKIFREWGMVCNAVDGDILRKREPFISVFSGHKCLHPFIYFIRPIR